MFLEFGYCNSRRFDNDGEKSLDPTPVTSESGFVNESEKSQKMDPLSLWGSQAVSRAEGPLCPKKHPSQIPCFINTCIFCMCHCLQRIRKQCSVCHFEWFND